MSHRNTYSDEEKIHQFSENVQGGYEHYVWNIEFGLFGAVQKGKSSL